MKYKTFLYGREIPDLIIEDGETWIRIDEKEHSYWSGLWPGIAFERLEVVRAKDYDPTRSSVRDPYGRPGRTSGRYSDGNYGSYHSFVDEGYQFERDDHAPLIDKLLWENSITNPVKGKDDGIRNFPGVA